MAAGERNRKEGVHSFLNKARVLEKRRRLLREDEEYVWYKSGSSQTSDIKQELKQEPAHRKSKGTAIKSL